MTNTDTPNVQHITRLFRSATPEQIVAGAQWYSDAYALASALAAKNDVSVEIAAGVIAACSPLLSWGANVNLAARFLSTPGGLHAGYLGAQLAKARAIAGGADIVKTLGGEKTINFYRSIVSAGREGVCIDRHAWSLAVNVRYGENGMPTLKGKRYALAVAAYKRAAVILSREYDTPLSAAQVQSVTWTLWRSKFWSIGAFDGHAEI